MPFFCPGRPVFVTPASAANVLFADGTVQTLFLKPNHKVSFGVTGAANFIDSDFRRYMLMIKWPNNGIHDSGSYPTE
jgi:prepilin-type processing-associated H-X9-DG protein